MTILRWIAFIPVALVAGFVVGLVPNLWADKPAWHELALGGCVSAIAFIEIGFKIAPRRNRTVKWLLIVISLCITVTGGALDLIAGYPETAWGPFSAALTSLIYGVIPLKGESIRHSTEHGKESKLS